MPSGRPANSQLTQVLVADDDPIFRHLVAERLVKLHGHAVESEDGADAWHQLSTRPFDAAIVDLNMPGLDGVALVQCIRGYPRTRHLPVVVITSLNDADTIKACLAAGATAFITKPVNWSLFEHHLGSLLRMAATERKFRSAQQVLEATFLVKDVAIKGLSAQVSTNATEIKHQIYEVLELVRGHADASAALVTIAKQLDSLKAAGERACHFSSVLSSQIDVSDEAVALDNIIDELVLAVAPEASAKAIDIKVGGNALSTQVRCDKRSIVLALGELLHNAIVYSQHGQTVSITTQSYQDGMLSIEIADHGCGMHPDAIARVMGGEEIEGSRHAVSAELGFGLPLACAIAKAHGGNLEVRSMPNQGTSALFFISPERVGLTPARVP